MEFMSTSFYESYKQVISCIFLFCYVLLEKTEIVVSLLGKSMFVVISKIIWSIILFLEKNESLIM